MSNPWKPRHQTAQQRRRRHKADPYRAQILAPKAVDMPRVLCAREGCGHPQLVHSPHCPVNVCTCSEYVEEET